MPDARHSLGDATGASMAPLPRLRGITPHILRTAEDGGSDGGRKREDGGPDHFRREGPPGFLRTALTDRRSPILPSYPRRETGRCRCR